MVKKHVSTSSSESDSDSLNGKNLKEDEINKLKQRLQEAENRKNAAKKRKNDLFGSSSDEQLKCDEKKKQQLKEVAKVPKAKKPSEKRKNEAIAITFKNPFGISTKDFEKEWPPLKKSNFFDFPLTFV